MTHFQMIRMAWAGAAVAGAFALAALRVMPMTGSLLTNLVLSGAIVTAGALIGGIAAYRIENAILALFPRGAAEANP